MNQPSSYFRVFAALVAVAAVVFAGNRAAVSQAPMQGRFAPPQGQSSFPQGQPTFAQGQYDNRAGGPQFYTANRDQGQPGANGSMIPPTIPAADPAAVGEAEGGGEETASSGTFASISDRLGSGGPLMIPLALCSFVVIALAVERLIVLRRGRIIPRPFVRRFTECVQDGQLSYEEALEICDEFECPVAEVFHATVKRWGRPTVEVEQAVMDAGERVADGLRRYLRLFHAISNVAPLLGLLGTVLGMIQAFETLSAANASSPPDMLAAGISQALITTAAGLSVAIPAYLAYIYFSARADRYLIEIDALCQQVVDSISAEGLQNGAGAGRAASKRTKKAA